MKSINLKKQTIWAYFQMFLMFPFFKYTQYYFFVLPGTTQKEDMLSLNKLSYQMSAS